MLHDRAHVALESGAPHSTPRRGQTAMPQGSLLSGAASAAARATAARAAFFASGRRLLPPLAVFGCFLAPGWGWRRPGRAPFFKDFAFCVPQNPKNFLASQGRTVTGPRVRVVDTSKSPDRRVRASGTRLTQHTWFPKKGRSSRSPTSAFFGKWLYFLGRLSVRVPLVGELAVVVRAVVIVVGRSEHSLASYAFLFVCPARGALEHTIGESRV